MEPRFNEYLKTLGMTDVFCQRVESIYDFYVGVLPEKITDIFVSEYLNNDGSRVFENLWIFTPNYTCEAKSFISIDNFDIMPIESVTRWELQKENYDFIKATEKSRLQVNFNLKHNLTGRLKASQYNCDNLRYIVLTYISKQLVNRIREWKQPGIV